MKVEREEREEGRKEEELEGDGRDKGWKERGGEGGREDKSTVVIMWACLEPKLIVR